MTGRSGRFALVDWSLVRGPQNDAHVKRWRRHCLHRENTRSTYPCGEPGVDNPLIETAIIKRAVCLGFRTKLEFLKSRSQLEVDVRPRQAVYYLARKHTLLSSEQIGRTCGGRDHATVIYGIKTIKNMLDAGDETLTEAMARVDQYLLEEILG